MQYLINRLGSNKLHQRRPDLNRSRLGFYTANDSRSECHTCRKSGNKKGSLAAEPYPSGHRKIETLLFSPPVALAVTESQQKPGACSSWRVTTRLASQLLSPFFFFHVLQAACTTTTASFTKLCDTKYNAFLVIKTNRKGSKRKMSWNTESRRYYFSRAEEWNV